MRGDMKQRTMRWIVALLADGRWPRRPQAPAKKPITHETLWMMKRVGAPVVSPDGRWAVYSVLEPSYEPKDAVSDLWLVATDGSTPARRITHTKEAKDDVDWSPDSTRIAFATKREGDEVAQIYILDLSPGGGEARRLSQPFDGRLEAQVASRR